MLTEWQVSPTVTLHGAGDKSPLLRGLGKVDAWDGEKVLDGDEPPVHLGSLLSTDTASRLTLDSPTYKQTHKVSLHHRHRQNRHLWNSSTPFTWYFSGKFHTSSLSCEINISCESKVYVLQLKSRWKFSNKLDFCCLFCVKNPPPPPHYFTCSEFACGFGF